jgi:hypothetical protein
LRKVFQSTFQGLSRFFEEQNNKFVGMGGVYPNLTYSYSFDSFQFLFLGVVDTIYPEIVRDLQAVYIATLNPNRLIDANMFRAAQQNYRPIQ